MSAKLPTATPQGVHITSVVVGLSGGVDSAAAVLLLQRAGYNVITAAINFSPAHTEAVFDAQKLAKQLKTEHHTLDATQRFEELVLRYFCDTYSDGMTPNPCIMCNPLVKFHMLRQLADSRGAKYIATGHYARVGEMDGKRLLVASTSKKDQSYMLYRLPQDIIERLLFPLESYDKQDTRRITREAGLPNSEKPDSQELCFCDDYADFLQSRNVSAKRGCFVLPDGRTIPHKGQYHYTIGQRKHLGVSYAHPLYVSDLSQNGDVVLSDKSKVLCRSISITDTVFHLPLTDEQKLYAKIRSSSAPTPCTISKTSDELYTLTFDSDVFASCPGQSAVLYLKKGEDMFVLGGGVIVV